MAGASSVPRQPASSDAPRNAARALGCTPCERSHADSRLLGDSTVKFRQAMAIAYERACGSRAQRMRAPFRRLRGDGSELETSLSGSCLLRSSGEARCMYRRDAKTASVASTHQPASAAWARSSTSCSVAPNKA